MERVILLLALVSCALASVAFDAWASQHERAYTTWGERQYREGVWKKNMQKIFAHNIRAVKGEKSYKMAMNHLGDYTSEEFKQLHSGCLKSVNGSLSLPKVHYKGSVFMAPVGFTAPAEIDFRKLGFVTKVKDQAQCGSCWAFSTTGSLEGQLFRKTGKLPSLSEQQLVDCAGGKFGNYGCDGGLMDNAFLYIMSVKGLESEASYPYTAEDGECVYKPSLAIGAAAGFMDIAEGNETNLQLAIASQGPVSIAIDASQSSFQFYSDGVYDEPQCSSTELDHGVLAVGYGTLNGVDFWLVKNSWGETWGKDGYIMMSRNKDNQCGVASSASFPLV